MQTSCQRRLNRFVRLGWAWLGAFGLFAYAQPAYSHNFVGAQRCASCHEFEYQVWQQSPHARSHETLTAEQLKDSKCNTCHTNTQDADPKFAGVQCEQCHGAGKYYLPSYVMKDHDLARSVGLLDTPPSSCQACHTAGAPSVTPFDYKSSWARIDHGKQARLNWERAHAKLSERPTK